MKLYRSQYKSNQKGEIGIVLNTAHFYPKDPNNIEDVKAAERAYGIAKFIQIYLHIIPLIELS